MPTTRERVRGREALGASWVALVVAAWALSCGGPVDPVTSAGQAPSVAAEVPPRPSALLRSMSDHLSAQEAFSFHFETSFEVFDRGQKLRFAGAGDVAIRRPDGMVLDYRDDLSIRRVWYDGTQLTLFDPVAGMYALAEAPPNLDDALDRFEELYGLVMPLTDLVGEDAYSLMASRVQRATYVGLYEVGGEACHHLAFVGESADLQLWIRDRDYPVPCKLVVDYKEEPGRPGYVAVMTDWEFGRRFSASHFVPEIPEGARRIEFLEVEEARR